MANKRDKKGQRKAETTHLLKMLCLKDFHKLDWPLQENHEALKEKNKKKKKKNIRRQHS